MQDNQSTPKLMVIRFGAMGDIIHAMPSLLWVKKHQPDDELHWLTYPNQVDLIQRLATYLGLTIKVWPLKSPNDLRQWWKLAQSVHDEGITTIVNWQPSLKTTAWTYLLKYLGGNNKRNIDVVSYKKERLKAKGSAQRQHSRRHAIEDFSRTVETALGLPPIDMKQAWPSSRKELQGVATLGIIPVVGNIRPNRAWPESYWHLLLQQLTAEYPQLSINVLGGNDATPIAKRLLAYPNVEDKTGIPLEKTWELLESCQLVIGGDTGPTHLTAALDIPTLGIYGPTSVQRTGPIGPQVINALTPLSSLECWPCELAQCPLKEKEHLLCMKQTTPEIVIDSIKEYLEAAPQQKQLDASSFKVQTSFPLSRESP